MELRKLELSELTDPLRKLNDKIDKRGSQQKANSNGDNRSYFGGRIFSRGDSYRGAQGGRGQYQVQDLWLRELFSQHAIVVGRRDICRDSVQR